MEDPLLVALLLALIIVHLEAPNNQPRRRYIAPVEYNSFEFRLDSMDSASLHAVSTQISTEQLSNCSVSFTKPEIRRLLPFLELDTILWRTRYQPTSELALCLVLVRQSFPQRLFQLSNLFGRSESYLSSVYNDTIEHLCLRYRQMLQWHPSLQYRRLRQYARAIRRVGGWTGGGKIRGFIDGTFRATCRPMEDQRFFYSGYKKHHGFKYQGIVCPDGLIRSIAGLYEGKMNDHQIVRVSRVQEDVRRVCRGHPQLFLYGDQAYQRLWGIMGPYRGGQTLDHNKATFNKTLSGVRIAVEQAFGQTQNLWLSNAFSIQLRPGQQPVAAFYMVSFLLTNCFTCLQGNSAAGSHFLLPPPTLEAYLSAI